jgi:hypothetical protein
MVCITDLGDSLLAAHESHGLNRLAQNAIEDLADGADGRVSLARQFDNPIDDDSPIRLLEVVSFVHFPELGFQFFLEREVGFRSARGVAGLSLLPLLAALSFGI